MYWVSHVVPKSHHSSATQALEAFLNDEADEIAEVVHISPQFPAAEPTLFGEAEGPPEPIAFVVVLAIVDNASQSDPAPPSASP